MHCEKHEAKALFTDSKTAEEPIGNERIGEKASTKCI
jgi:hypothetical protein